MIANYDGQCANCGQVFSAGEDIHYYPASGDVAVRTEHVTCPAPRQKRKGQNLGQRVDVDDIFSSRYCAKCGSEYSVRKGTATPNPFVCANTDICAAYVASKARAA